MDVSLSAKLKSLSLVPFAPLSSFSFSDSSLAAVRVGSLGREFSGRNLRPTYLCSRRKCKKLGLHIRSPRFLSRASLDSQSSVLVLTVVTVSALTVVLLDYSRRMKKNVREVSDSPFLVVSHHVRGFLMNQIIENQSLGRLGMDKVRSVNESNYVDDLVHLQLKETAMMPSETLLITSTLIETPGSNIIVASTSVTDSMPPKESEVPNISFPLHVLSESGVRQTLVRTMKLVPKLQFEGRALIDTEPASVLSALVQTQSSAGSAVTGHDNNAREQKRTTSKEIGVFRESGRKGLYMFYGANKSTAESVSILTGLRTLSSNASLQNSDRFSSLKRKSTSIRVKLSAQDFIQTSESKIVSSDNSTEGKTSIAWYKEDSPPKSTNLGKNRGYHREEEDKMLPQDGQRCFSQPSQPNGIDVSDKNYPSRQISAYNRLLKDGRLLDCLELLEDMEGNGVLNMDKVYHAGFLKTCQRQRSIEEAFRFTKLIPNPSLSTFNMLMSVCASSQDSQGAFEVMRLVQEAGLKADCKLYTNLISTCAKSGKVDAMFKVFHEMVSAEVEPNVHTYGALIDGCAKAGQVAKAFGAYGIMRSKNVKPDRVVFNALITACGKAGAVDRAFDVLAEMAAETQPIDPDQITIGALIKACTNAGQVGRAREVYDMVCQYDIKGTPEVYTIAVNSCSQTGDWDFACNVYSDMKKKGVIPDEMFLSSLIDVAGNSGKLDAAFDVLKEARKQGIHLGIISYSSLMGACSNAKNWKKALDLYEEIKSIRLKPTVSTMNALITTLCNGDQLQKALEALSEMKRVGLRPNTITYSVLFVASEKKDDVEVGVMLFSQAKKDGVTPNLIMSKCLIAMCLRRFEKACKLGEPVLSFNSGRPQLDSKWTALALMVYRETVVGGILPTMQVLSQVLGCLQLPRDASLRNRLIEHLVSTDSPKRSYLWSLVDGFGEYDPRAFSLFEEAASLGIVQSVSFKERPIVVDASKLEIHAAEVYLLTVLKGLKHRLAAGATLPNILILLPIEKTEIQSSMRKKTINVAGRISQAIASLLRRLGLSYLGNESYGKIRINGVTTKRWLRPRLASPFFSGKLTEMNSSSSQSRLLGRGISDQQRSIRTGNLSFD